MLLFAAKICPTMKSLLVATDFSETALAAERFAARLAACLQARVYLVHSYLPAYPVTDPMVLVPLVEEGWEELYRQEAEARLQERAGAFRQLGLTCDTLVQIGPLTDVVLAVVETTRAECVVVGRTTDHSWITDLFGSQATHLLETLKVPLLMVPAGAATADLSRVVYATSLEFDEIQPLRAIFALARALQVPVELLKISVAGEPDIVPDHQLIADIRAAFPQETYELMTLKAPSLADGLEAHARQGGPALLVMASQHRNLLSQLVNPSQSRHMLLHGHLPVLIYRIIN